MISVDKNWLWSITMDDDDNAVAHQRPAFAWRTGRDPGALTDRWSPIAENAFDGFAKDIASNPNKWCVWEGDDALRKLLGIPQSNESLHVFSFVGQPWPEALRICVLGFKGDVLAALL